MSNYQFSIVTPEGEAYKGEVESLMAPGEFGSFGVLSDHAPMIVSLKPGPLTLVAGGQKSYFNIGAGVLEVNDQNHVLLLADCAQSASSYEDAKQMKASHE